MLIEIRDGYWVNLRGVKSVYIGRAKLLGTGTSGWHVLVECGDYNTVSNSETFETREEAKAFAKIIVAELNGENKK